MIIISLCACRGSVYSAWPGSICRFWFGPAGLDH